jgi:methionine synthase II (cobalamin-independent)
MGKLCILKINKIYIKISIQITIPTELIGSLPRTTALLEGQQAYKAGHISLNQLDKLQDHAVRQTLSELEKTGPGQLTDGEQAKPSFLVYPYVFEFDLDFSFYKQ